MRNIFTDHPHSVGETYLQHGKFALLFGINMLKGGIACVIHAIFPFLFQTTGSNILFNMAHFFIERVPLSQERIYQFAKLIQKKQADSELKIR